MLIVFYLEGDYSPFDSINNKTFVESFLCAYINYSNIYVFHYIDIKLNVPTVINPILLKKETELQKWLHNFSIHKKSEQN